MTDCTPPDHSENKKRENLQRFMKNPYLFACFIATSTLWSSFTTAQQSSQPSADANAAESRHLPDPRQEAMAQLAKSQSPDTEVIWLETQLEAFLGLYHPANAAEPIGTALILPHDRTSPDWPEMVHSIRTELPNQDWNTLAIAMPEEPRPTAPTRQPDTSEPTDSAQAEPNSFKDKVFERIDAGVNTAREKSPKRLLLIGVGTGAYWASRYLNEKPPANSTLLVLIDARPPLGEIEPTLAEAVAKITIPTADLMHSALPDNNYMEHLAKRRKNQAIRDSQPYYLQRKIPGKPVARQNTDRVLVNILRGVLEERMLNMIPSEFLKNNKGNNMKPGQ